MVVSRSSMKWVAKNLRIFASMLVFLYSSDELPPPAVEQGYLDALREARWNLPTISTASNLTSTITVFQSSHFNSNFTQLDP